MSLIKRIFGTNYGKAIYDTYWNDWETFLLFYYNHGVKEYFSLLNFMLSCFDGCQNFQRILIQEKIDKA